MKRLLIMAAACAFAVTALAQQYKWVDKNGKTQYGDAPPPGVKATRIKGSSTAAPPPAAEAKKDGASKDKPLTPEAAFRKRQQEKDEAEKKAAQDKSTAESRRQNCEQAQAQLRQLESGQRISSVNSAGERVYLDDDARAGQIQRAQKAVSEWCR